MKKRHKIFVFIGIILVVGIILKTYFTPETRIISFVKTNEEDLHEIALDYLADRILTYGEEQYYKNVEICGVRDSEYPVVEFFYSGKGIVPSGVYYGFYYSPDDEPVAVMDYGRLLTLSGDEEWTWSGSGDNGGRTGRIIENWFYYETWF